MSQSKRVALGHERSLTLLPPIFKLSFCVLLLSSRSFPVSGVKLPPWLAPSQDFFPFILPLYRNALPIPQLFLHLQSDEVAPKWREWHSRKNGDPTCLFLNTSFLDKCLECHLHMLYFCFFLSHFWICVSVTPTPMTLALSKSSTLPEKPNPKSMHSLCLYLNSYSIYNSLFLEPSPLSWTDTFYPFGFSQCCIPASSLLERSSKELGGYWHHHTAPSSWDFPHANPFFGLTHTPSPLQFSKTLLG